MHHEHKRTMKQKKLKQIKHPVKSFLTKYSQEMDRAYCDGKRQAREYINKGKSE